MENLSRNKIIEMTQVKKPNCLSIFIPTHRAGQEVNNRLDQKQLKNQVKQVKMKLESHQIKNSEMANLLQPINALTEDTNFWVQQSDGLAIFRNKESFEYYKLPVSFEPFHYISDHYYLKPLVPYLNDNVRFYLLALSLNEVKFYEGFPHQIDLLEMNDLLPGNINEVVGYDFDEKNLQFRTGQSQSQGNEAIYHGHGKGKDDTKNEILKFFKAIDKGLMKIISNKKEPLIIAAVDYLVPLYREVNKYQYLFENFIPGNPEQKDPILLHEQAKNMLESYYTTNKTEKVMAFEKALSDALASYNEEEIITASINRRVDTLFIKNRETMWGIYDRKEFKILEREEDDLQSVCLLNLACIHTILNGGQVFLTEPDEMPEKSSRMNAIFRF